MSEEDPNFLLKSVTLYPSKPKLPAWLIVEDESQSESEDKSWLGTCSKTSTPVKVQEEESVDLHCDIDFMELPFYYVDFIEETAVCLGTTYVRPSQPPSAAVFISDED